MDGWMDEYSTGVRNIRMRIEINLLSHVSAITERGEGGGPRRRRRFIYARAWYGWYLTRKLILWELKLGDKL